MLRRWLPRALTGLLAVALLWGGLACHGRVIRAEFVPNRGVDFDFGRPPCPVAARPDADPEDVLVRYLGTSGLYVAWRGAALLAGPFFSNYDPLQVALGTVRPDREAIERGMSGLPAIPVRAVLAGHAHYDHVGDLAPVIEGWAPLAQVLVNRSARAMLERCPGAARARFVDAEGEIGRWVPIVDEHGAVVPLRVMPLESEHAPQLSFWRFAAGELAEGELAEPWDCVDGHPLRKLRQGRALTFLIDLLDPNGRPVFRIHYQDTASGRGHGTPPAEVIDQHPVDLAVLCMPSSWNVEGYPEHVLDETLARHALVTHYEDFFRRRDKPLRFLPTLTNGRAHAFMTRVRDEMDDDHGATGPVSPVCGPSGPAWSMPLPGEWLRFRAAP